MRRLAIVALMGLLGSCGTTNAILDWRIETAQAQALLGRVADRAQYYSLRIAELDRNKDGALDIWELLRGLMVLREALNPSD